MNLNLPGGSCDAVSWNDGRGWSLVDVRGRFGAVGRARGVSIPAASERSPCDRRAATPSSRPHESLRVARVNGGTIATAQVSLLPGEVERVDVIAIERDGRDVFAFDAVAGGRATERLELDETVVFQATRGRLGLLITDRRALAVDD